MKKIQSGFTLVEVLLATAILSLMVTVIYASFSTAGRNVEQAEANRDRTDLARTLIARLSDDISNAYLHASMKETFFKGTQSTTDSDKPRFDSIAMTTLTNWRKPDSKETDLWEVGYRFEERPDGSGKVLVRHEKRELKKDAAPGEGGSDMELTDRIAEFRVRYYTGLASTVTSSWDDNWDSAKGGATKVPKAVEIRLTMDDGTTYLTMVEAGRR